MLVTNPAFNTEILLKSFLPDYDKDVSLICGLDEVGRGALAGPIVGAAVVLPPGYENLQIKDSKQLSAKKREELAILIKDTCLAYKIILIPASEINHKGIGWANKELFYKLSQQVEADIYCCDGNLKLISDRNLHSIIKGDEIITAIAAASIVAKVYRDNLMEALNQTYPGYYWDKNKGYGTKTHLNAISLKGPCAEHRTLFIRNILSRQA